jgi:streptogramin lyase
LTDNDCALERQVCDWRSTRRDCFFREYELPQGSGGRMSLSGFFQPGHVLVARDGAIWFTAYAGGNYVGRLVPEHCDRDKEEPCTIDTFPLSVPRGTHHAVPLAGAGPWQIVEADNGDILFTEFFENALSRLHVARLRDPRYDCRQLHRSGRNSCLTEAQIPVSDQAAVQLHSLAFDAQGRVWFTQSTDVCSKADRTAESSVGFIRYPTPETPEVLLFPPLSMYEFDPPKGFCGDEDFAAYVGTGIAVDRATEDVWFADLMRRRIGRVRRIALTESDGRQ